MLTRTVQAWFIIATILLAWFGMQAVHEVGHVAHALASGVRIVRVNFPLLGFSSTTVASTTRFVVWGGAIWGVVLPMVMDQVARIARWRFRFLTAFFAGFCLIANGAYLGAGWIVQAGDAGDLLRLGTPRWQLIAFGLIGFIAGLAHWNNLGPHFGLGAMRGRVDGGAVIFVSVLLLIAVVTLAIL